MLLHLSCVVCDTTQEREAGLVQSSHGGLLCPVLFPSSPVEVPPPALPSAPVRQGRALQCSDSEQMVKTWGALCVTLTPLEWELFPLTCCCFWALREVSARDPEAHGTCVALLFCYTCTHTCTRVHTQPWRFSYIMIQLCKGHWKQLWFCPCETSKATLCRGQVTPHSTKPLEWHTVRFLASFLGKLIEHTLQTTNDKRSATQKCPFAPCCQIEHFPVLFQKQEDKIPSSQSPSECAALLFSSCWA